MNQFLPRRPRGAYFVVLSIAACKVGRRIRHRGFVVGWYHLSPEPTDRRRLRSDDRTRFFSVQFYTRIEDALMFGDRILVRLTFRPATDISSVYSL